MKYKRLASMAAACAALASPASWAADSSAYASIYDIRFDADSLEVGYIALFTFGPNSPEATTAEATSNGNVLLDDMNFVAGSSLYASLLSSASIAEGGGVAWAYAQTGAGFMTAAGATNISSVAPAGPRGTYAATTALNQEYGGASTFGGWLTLAPMTSITMSGSYDLVSSIGGTLCGPIECSAAVASVSYSLGGDFGEDTAHVDGSGGPDYRQTLGQGFSLTFANNSYDALDVFFSTSASVSGFVAGGLAQDGGGGSVPEPGTLALMALGLGLAGWQARGRRTARPADAVLPAAAA